MSKKSHETGVFLKKITKLQKLENHQNIGKLIQKGKVSFICKFSMSSKIFVFFFSQTKWTSKYDNFDIDIFKLP